MSRALVSIGLIALGACLSAQAATAENVNVVKTRIYEMTGSDVAYHLREIAAEDNCQIKIGADVDEARTALATRLGGKLGVSAEVMPEVQGLLVAAYEKGFDQLMRENALDVNFAEKTAMIAGCK